MRKATERACVNRLIKAIIKNSVTVYIHVDRDSGTRRHTSSGWDFLISDDGRVSFNEAKMENEKLTEWQQYTRASITAAGTLYNIVRFFDSGETFTVNGSAKVPIDEATRSDFL